MSYKKLGLFALVAGLLTGCMASDQPTIYCNSFRVEGIIGDIVDGSVANVDTDGDGVNDALQIVATVIRLDTSEVLYLAPRVVIPVGESADGIGFTSDEFDFPAAPEGTVLQIDYTSHIDFTGFPSPPFPSGPEEVSLLSYTGACQLAPGDPDEPDEPDEPDDPDDPALSTPRPEWFSPGDDRLNPDAHAYAAVYCDETFQRVLIYGVNSPGAGDLSNGSGYFALEVPYSELPPTPTDTNVLIAEVDGVRFYRNVQGEFVVVAGPDFEGKEYVVLWDGCPASYVQRFILQGDRLQRTG